MITTERKLNDFIKANSDKIKGGHSTTVFARRESNKYVEWVNYDPINNSETILEPDHARFDELGNKIVLYDLFNVYFDKFKIHLSKESKLLAAKYIIDDIDFVYQQPIGEHPAGSQIIGIVCTITGYSRKRRKI